MKYFFKSDAPVILLSFVVSDGSTRFCIIPCNMTSSYQEGNVSTILMYIFGISDIESAPFDVLYSLRAIH